MKMIEFGYVGVDYNLYQEIEVHNTGDSDLRLIDVSPSCDCSRTSITDSIVPPGATTNVRLQFNTKNWYGDTEQLITIVSNDPDFPQVQIPYHSYVGQWVKGVLPSPKAIFFLPGKNMGEISILNSEYNRLNLQFLDQSDPWFRVELAQNKAAKGGKLVVKVLADDSLGKGTFEGSFRLQVDAEGRDEPVVLSIPVKIVKY